MTLKSLNMRSAKLIRKMAVMAGLVLVTISLFTPTRWSVEATGFNPRPAEADNAIPSLQGVTSIAYLKEHKLYDSLRTALNAERIRQRDNSVVTPLVIDEQTLTASDGVAGDEFGLSIALSGSTMVVGAAGRLLGNVTQDAAYVFERRGGSWIETQKLTASDGGVSNSFGSSVALSGSTIVVGAPFESINGNFAQGSAYVFNRHGGSWTETQKLTASNGAERDQFGLSVALSGSTIVVGAQSAEFSRGAAYVFNRQGESWTETQKLTASDGEGFDSFGFSVALSGSAIVVGAPGDSIGDTFSQGSAYVFNRQGGSWVEAQKLTASDGVEVANFGLSIAFSGSTLVVGAPNDTIGDNFGQGSAYVFNRQGESWTETQKLTASGGADRAQFGRSIALSGSIIVVGAPFGPIGNNIGQGAAYVFNRRGGSWTETRQLTASDGEALDAFGFSVALSSSTIVIGAPFHRVGLNAFQGAVYLFEP